MNLPSRIGSVQLKLLRLILLTSVECIGVMAAARPGKVLQQACLDAQNVFLGTIESTVASAPPARFTIRVDEVVSGQVASKAIVRASWPGSLVGSRTVSAGYQALWFLRQTSSVAWEILPIGGLKAPIFASVLAVPPVTGQGARVPSPSGCYEAVLRILGSNAEYVDRSLLYFTAMETLLGEDPPPMSAAGPGFTKMLDTISQSPSPTTKALALGAGIRRGEIRALTQLADQSSAVDQSKAGHHVRFAVSAWRSSDPEGLAALGRLANDVGGSSLNHSAAEALMMIHTKGAVPQLVRMLTSKDVALRGMGIRGLSMFVRGVPILTPESIRTMKYLDEKPSEYWDPGIAPYISITSLPPEREAAFVNAWTSWALRQAQKIAN